MSRPVTLAPDVAAQVAAFIDTLAARLERYPTAAELTEALLADKTMVGLVGSFYLLDDPDQAIYEFRLGVTRQIVASVKHVVHFKETEISVRRYTTVQDPENARSTFIPTAVAARDFVAEGREAFIRDFRNLWSRYSYMEEVDGEICEMFATAYGLFGIVIVPVGMRSAWESET